MTYTTTDAAQLLGVSRRRIQQLMVTIRAQKVGRDYIIDEETLERLKSELAAAKVGRPRK